MPYYKNLTYAVILATISISLAPLTACAQLGQSDWQKPGQNSGSGNAGGGLGQSGWMKPGAPYQVPSQMQQLEQVIQGQVSQSEYQQPQGQFQQPMAQFQQPMQQFQQPMQQFQQPMQQFQQPMQQFQQPMQQFQQPMQQSYMQNGTGDMGGNMSGMDSMGGLGALLNAGGDSDNLGKAIGIASQMGLMPGQGGTAGTTQNNMQQPVVTQRSSSGRGISSIPGAATLNRTVNQTANRAANTASSLGNVMLNRMLYRGLWGH